MRCYEFVDLCKEFAPTRIIFDSRNQDWNYSPLRFYLTFSEVMYDNLTNCGMFLTHKTKEERIEKGEIELQFIRKVKVSYPTSESMKAVVYCEVKMPNGRLSIKQKFTLLLMK